MGISKIDRIEDEFKSIDGISEVSIYGLPEKEIEISVSEEKLLEQDYEIFCDNIIIHSLGINDISNRIKRNSYIKNVCKTVRSKNIVLSKFALPAQGQQR